MNFALFARLGRISNLPTIWTNVLAAASLSGEIGPRLFAVGIVTTCLYMGGMLLNDAYDASKDAVERPKRPIPAGEISRQSVFQWGFAMLGGATVLAFSLGLRVGFATLLTAGAILVYDALRPAKFSPLVMGMCRLGVYAIAGLSVAHAPGCALWAGGALLMVYVLGLTYAAGSESQGGVVRMLPLMALYAPLAWIVATWGAGMLLLAISAGFAAWVWRAISLVRGKKTQLIQEGVTSLIAGVSLLDAAYVANCGEIALSLACVGGFGLTRALQTRIAGT